MNEEKPVRFTFVHAKAPEEAKGWWLKITDIETLTAYAVKTRGNARMRKAFDLYCELHQKGQEYSPAKSVKEVLNEMPAEERVQNMIKNPSVYNTLYGAIAMAESVNGTILDGFRCLNMESGSAYLRHIRQDGVCFINKMGGCNDFIEYDDWCSRNDLIWPDFKMSDIRLKQYPKGRHWYAFIGDMEVHNGDTLRFDTKEDAHMAAANIVNTN